MIVDNTQIQDIDYILDNLSDKNIRELKIHFGENWKNYVKSEMLANLDKHSITGKTDDNTPVIVTGILNDNGTSGWLYFLHTDEIANLPLFELIKKSKKQVNKWMNDYDILNACILNTNTETIKWAELTGFKPVNIQGDFIVLTLEKEENYGK